MEKKESMWICTVPVATIWTSPDSPRTMDEEGIAAPQILNRWLAKMSQEDRFALCKEQRVQSQLVYGEPVVVESVQGDWAQVIAVWQQSKKNERGYPGWVPLDQLREAEPIVEPDGVVRTDVSKCQLWEMIGTPSDLIVPFNTILPRITSDKDWVSVATPHGERRIRKQDVVEASSVHHFQKYDASVAAERAMEFLDLPYFWGGMSSYGYDCSGLTYNMLKACGLFIPRDASDQAREGEEIAIKDVAAWQRGDLLFFADESTGNVNHVGFYYGEGLMIHATASATGAVEVREIVNTPYAKRLSNVRRYKKETGIL